MHKDLLQIKFLGSLLKSTWFWRISRLLLLAMMVAMIAYGWHQHAIPGVTATDPLMYTNLATYGLWVIWLMAVVFVALLFGRLWCSFCPLGWLNGLVAQMGLKLALPGWLNNQFPVTLVLIVLQLAVYLLAIHRYPDFTSTLLSVTLGLTILCGLLFRQRTFCQLFCPAGAVFALYARVAPFHLRVRQTATCDSCNSQRCVSGERIWKRFSLGRGVFYWNTERHDCPVALEPVQLSDDSGCTLCLHCLHNCEHDNLQLGFRPWLAELGQSGLRSSETLFLLVLLGMLTANFSKVNIPLRELLFWLPQQVALLLGWQSAGYSVLSVFWVCLLLPLLLVLPGALLFRMRNLQSSIRLGEVAAEDFVEELPTKVEVEPFWTSLGQLLLPFIPLVLVVHLILALVKLNAKGGYLPLVLQDPSGVQSYLAIHVMQTLSQPAALVSLDLLKWLVLALLLVGYFLSLYAAKRVAGQRFSGRVGSFYFCASLLGLSLSAGLYLDTVIRWLFIR